MRPLVNNRQIREIKHWTSNIIQKVVTKFNTNLNLLTRGGNTGIAPVGTSQTTDNFTWAQLIPRGQLCNLIKYATSLLKAIMQLHYLKQLCNFIT